LFKKIIDNIASPDTKTMFSCHKGLSTKEFCKYQKSKRRRAKYINKKYKSAKEVFLEYKFSKTFMDELENGQEGNKYIKNIKKIAKIAKQLIGLRNELLNLYKELSDYSDTTQIYLKFEKTDLAKFGLITERVRQAGFLGMHKLWDIPVKKEGQEVYQQFELTEEDS